MKNNKNLQIISLFATALSLIMALFTLVFDSNRFNTDNILIISLLSICTVMISLMYILLIARRVNPKQYIYISYTSADKETAQLITSTLEGELNKFSKYHYEILSADSIPYGSDIHKTVEEYLEKSTIIIVVVSENYLISSWCRSEFISTSKLNKKIIPIVVDSYQHLSELPKDISNIKALSLRECSSTDEFKRHITSLAKELVRQRQD